MQFVIDQASNGMLIMSSQRAAAPFMASSLVAGALIPSIAFAEAPEDLVRYPTHNCVCTGC